MIAELQRLGWQVDVIDLGDGFPRPGAATQTAAARERLPASPNGCPIVIDGLAFGVLPEAAGELRERTSADRTGASSAGAGNRSRARRRRGVENERTRGARRRARRRRDEPVDRGDCLIDDYDVPPEHHHGRRGRAPIAASRRKGSSDGIVRLLAVGAVVPRKGYDVLIAALAPLAGPAVAADDRRRPHAAIEAAAAQLDADIASHELAGADRRAGRAAGRSSRRALYRRRSVRAGRRASRATAWRSPRRWRMACR